MPSMRIPWQSVLLFTGSMGLVPKTGPGRHFEGVTMSRRPKRSRCLSGGIRRPSRVKVLIWIILLLLILLVLTITRSDVHLHLLKMV